MSSMHFLMSRKRMRINFAKSFVFNFFDFVTLKTIVFYSLFTDHFLNCVMYRCTTLLRNHDKTNEDQG